MKTINKLAAVEEAACIGCGTCIKLCPVVAISIKMENGRRKAAIDESICQGCNICVSRCPVKALRLTDKPTPREVGMGDFIVDKDIENICTAAHMYPEQVVCFCHRVQAKDIAKALLSGAGTPEEVSRMTGARAGCGTLCITGVLRLLQAAGRKLEKAPGTQWYGEFVTIWDIPPAVMEKYGKQYYLKEDQEFMKKMFPGGDSK